MKKLVKCQGCGVTLEVPQRGSEPQRVVRCPNCSHQIAVTFSLPPQPPATNGRGVDTVYAGGGRSGQPTAPGGQGDTVLAPPTNIRRALLRIGGHDYELKPGRNIVGRGALGSPADVQIDTTDRTMSRQHAIMKVTRTADGRLRTLISNYQNRKAIVVQGVELQQADEVVLTKGATVVMGGTTLTYIEE